MKKLFILFLLCLMVFPAVAQLTISGTVTDDTGGPLPGVTVVPKGAVGSGTITDEQGVYRITVAAETPSLVFSFIGMKTLEEPVNGRDVINVALVPEVSEIKEVVVTALGISREKKALAYTVEAVDDSEIAKSGNAHVLNALNGKVAGVTITNTSGSAGAASFIEIRGSGSITRSNRPLFVVDGVPIDGGGIGLSGNVSGFNTGDRAGDLNPEDIESVTVLKSGAASALYGLRAANGVIIITTKKGGDSKGKTKVNISSSVRIERVSQLPPLQTTYGQGSNYLASYLRNLTGLPVSSVSYADDNVSDVDRVVTSWGPHIDSLRYTTDPDYIPGYYYLYGGTTPMDEWMENWDPNGRIVTIDDPFASNKPVQTYDPYDFLKTGVTYTNNVSLSGGNANSTFYLSYGNVNSKGIIPNNTYIKNTLKLSGQSKLSDKWTISADANYIENHGDKQLAGSNTSAVMLGLMRTPPTFDNSYGYQFADNSQRAYRGGAGYDNPYWSANNIKYKDNINRFIGNASVLFQAAPWLNFTWRVGTDWYNYRYYNWFEKGSSEYPGGFLSREQDFVQDITSTLLMNITRDLGESADMNLTMGGEMYQNKGEIIYANSLGFLDSYNWIDLLNTNSHYADDATFSKRTAAMFATLNLSWKDALFLDLTAREEWSTTLPQGENAFFYPSASLGWVFTSLEGLKRSKVLSYGKLRTSYAITGRDAALYSTETGWVSAGAGDGWVAYGFQYPYLGYSGWSVSNVLGNADLKPESQKAFEVGADLRFFNGRINVEMAVYRNLNEHLLMSAPIAPTTGYGYIYENAASMKTTGMELLLDIRPVQAEAFSWNITANFSNPHSVVTGLYGDYKNVSLNVGFPDPQIHAITDEPYRSIWGSRWLRDDQGRLVINNDPSYPHAIGYPQKDVESGLLGNVQEKFRLGITNTFTIKSITISALLEIKRGGQMWNGTKGALYYFGTHKDTELRNEQVALFEGVYGYQALDGSIVYTDVDGNPLADGQSPVANTQEVKLDERWYYRYGGFAGPGNGFNGPSEQFIEKTDWVRLRELTISYALPAATAEKLSLGMLEIYFTGTNLLLFTPYTGVDPETSLFGIGNAQGADYFNLPGTKSMTFGVRLGF